MTDAGKLHRPTYGKTPELLMHDLRITDGAVRLYAHMAWRYGDNGDNHEGMKKMAEFMGVSEAAVSKRIKELEARDWIVVVERGYNPQTGKYQTPFYHVFVSQKDCCDFRQSYECADGERIRPKPLADEVRERKSRAGAGGNPKLKNRPNSSSPGNSSLDVRPNSSSDNLDSFDLDSVKDIAPKKGASTKTDKPKRITPYEPHYIALAAAFRVDATKLPKTASGMYWKAANELYTMNFPIELIPAFYRWCIRQDWKSFTVMAMAKHAPDWLANHAPKAQSQPTPQATPALSLDSTTATYEEWLAGDYPPRSIEEYAWRMERDNGAAA